MTAAPHANASSTVERAPDSSSLSVLSRTEMSPSAARTSAERSSERSSALSSNGPSNALARNPQSATGITAIASPWSEGETFSETRPIAVSTVWTGARRQPSANPAGTSASARITVSAVLTHCGRRRRKDIAPA